MNRIMITLTGVLAALGLTLVASPAASAAPTDIARAWAQVSYEVATPTGTAGDTPGALNATACTQIVDATTPTGVAFRAHSAALVDDTRTVRLFNSTNCAPATLVSTLNATNKADSGFTAGSPNQLGTTGATHYIVT